MARVTVEDCITKVADRFELVMVASQRARELSYGAPLTVEKDNDKNPVIALREIADATVTVEGLKESMVREYQTASMPSIDDEARPASAESTEELSQTFENQEETDGSAEDQDPLTEGLAMDFSDEVVSDED